MILTIDIGNTSAKLAIMDSLAAVHFERLTECWDSTLQKLANKFGTPDAVVISNVAGPQPELEDSLSRLHWSCEWISWDDERASHILTNIPQGLGADRLAADIGARHLAPESDLLVVDAGTCLTFDVIDHTGRYLGGNISPGISLRLQAMHDHTAQLPLYTPEGPAPVIGTDLETAMRGGCLNGLRWEIEGYVRHLLAQGMTSLRVFYTGGNDLNLATDIEPLVIHDPLLIHKGLVTFYLTH